MRCAKFQMILEWIESLTETKKTQSKSLKITHLSKFQPLVLSNLSGIEANDLPPLATTGGSYGHGAESGSERIVIATAPRLQFGDNWLLRQALENQHQALQLRHGIGFPDKQIWMVLRYV